MTLYFIDYDLRNSRDYNKLYEKLKEFNAIRVFESVWCFKRINTTVGKLRDYFKQYIDSDDGLSITEINDWSTFNALGTPNDLQ